MNRDVGTSALRSSLNKRDMHDGKSSHVYFLGSNFICLIMRRKNQTQYRLSDQFAKPRVHYDYKSRRRHFAVVYIV